MAAEDYIGCWPGDAGFDDLHDGSAYSGPSYYQYTPKPVTCNFCGAKGLRWKQHNSGKWWLVLMDDSWHKCR